MSDPDEYNAQIDAGKCFVTNYIQKERLDYAEKIKAMEWGRSSEDIDTRVHVLVLWVDDKRHLIKFLEKDLADASETVEIRYKLGQQIDEFFEIL